MILKFFRKNNQRRTVLACAAHSPSGGHLSRVAHLSCLLVLLTATFCAVAQNGVTVDGLVVDAGTVTFNVSWEKNDPTMPAIWSDTVWVWVDYNTAGTMTRLPLSAGATLTATSAPAVAKVMEVSGNDRGVWVIGNAKTAASGSFSATVKVQTPKLGVFAGACVYASNYRPVGEYTSTTNMVFTGTPMYDIVLLHEDASTMTRKSDSPFSVPAGYTIQSFSDATGAPGIIKCMPMTGNINFSVPLIVSKSRPASFALIAIPTAPAASAITYTWSAPGFVPNTCTGTPFNTTAPATANTYPVTLTALSKGYCDLSVTNNVTVIDCVPPATFTLVASASGFCEDDAAGVTFALQGTESGRKYRLYRDSNPVGNVLTGTGSAETFTGGPFVTPGVYTAESEVEGQYCGVVMSGSHPISKNLNPTVPTISQPADVCYNSGDLVFTIMSYSGTPTWTDVGGGVESGLSVTFTSGAVAGTKTVKAQSAQTYNNAPTCYSAEVTKSANVNPLPTVASVVGNSRCGTGTVTISAVPSDGAVIEWYAAANDGAPLLEGNNTYTTSILTSTTYYAQARNSTTNCLPASRTAVLAAVLTPPTAAPTGLAPNVNTICNGIATSVILTASGGAGGSGAVYEWGTGTTVGSSSLGTTSGNTCSVRPSVATTYWVRLKGTAACGSVTVPGGATTSVGVYSSIAAGAITGGTKTTDEETNPGVTIGNTTSASGGSGSVTYQWRRTGTSSATLKGSSATYTIGSDDYFTAGTYYFVRYARDATCSNAAWLQSANSYTLYVNWVNPAYFYSPKKWKFGALTWSDHVVANPTNCEKRGKLNQPEEQAAYVTYSTGDDGATQYFYNWFCATGGGTPGSTNPQLCPSGWRLPSTSDVIALMESADFASVWAAWGATHIAGKETYTFDRNYGYIATSDYCELHRCYYGVLVNALSRMEIWCRYMYAGLLVRCVK